MKTQFMKFSLFLFSLMYLSSFLCAQTIDDKTMLASGCNTAYFLIEGVIDGYRNESGVTIVPKKGGNKVAVKLLDAKSIDFAFTCKEHKGLVKNLDNPVSAENWKTVKFAKDPVVIIVNKDNPVENLTLEQVAQIYAGNITNWKDVGGNDETIKICYQSESLKSGVYTVFIEQTLGRDEKGELKPLSSVAVDFPDTDKRGAYVAQNTGATTFMGLDAFNQRYGKVIKINNAEALPENIRLGTYPIAATYYIIYDVANKDRVEKFLDYLNSKNGMKHVNKTFVSDIQKTW